MLHFYCLQKEHDEHPLTRKNYLRMTREINQSKCKFEFDHSIADASTTTIISVIMIIGELKRDV